MNTKFIYFIAAVVFIGLTAFIVIRYNKKQIINENRIYTLLERKGSLAHNNEWEKLKSNARFYLTALETNPNNVKASLGLASLYIQEARVTGNHMYYDMAAMKYVNDVLKKDSLNFEALLYKSILFLSQHHFADGLKTAEMARKVNPYNAYVYGILVDGNVEMGYYDSAVINSDRMVSIRPDLNSYSRISYLREIYGDYPGAIQAMKMAVNAGGPGEESTEWARVQLGSLYEKTGDLKNAEMHYTIALDERPNYPYANAGLGRIAMGARDYNKAIALFLKADSTVSDYAFKEELVDAYLLNNEKEKANSTAKAVIENLTKDAQKGNADESVGHYADRELAYAYLKINETGKALEHALLEYNRRPDNIDVNETLAWVYYKKEDINNAVKYIATALKTKSRNPTLLCRAGLIYFKSGNKEFAKTTLKKALENNPNIDLQIKDESSKILQSL